MLVKNKWKSISGTSATVIIVVMFIFPMSPQEIIFAQLDKRYAQSEQVQQVIQKSEQNILNFINASRIEQLEGEIYQLDKLEAEGTATPDDIARRNKLLRQLNDLRAD